MTNYEGEILIRRITFGAFLHPGSVTVNVSVYLGSLNLK